MQHEQPPGGQNVTIRVGRDATGQITVGHHVTAEQHQTTTTVTPAMEPVADRADLTTAIAGLRDLIETAGLDANVAADALAKLDDLEEAVTADVPDLATMEHVQGWFRRRLPQFADAVRHFLLDPLVSSTVSAAGDELAQELTRRLGG
ncbi:hypothetical protein ACGFZQ_28955 [Streptomyces sp. NPDC048254]|uniref:hypothetical protein n=1 Tax=Streptomyces sp. NPDC048254 TaxID=3365525 RepID=UPI003712CD97